MDFSLGSIRFKLMFYIMRFWWWAISKATKNALDVLGSQFVGFTIESLKQEDMDVVLSTAYKLRARVLGHTVTGIPEDKLAEFDDLYAEALSNEEILMTAIDYLNLRLFFYTNTFFPENYKEEINKYREKLEKLCGDGYIEITNKAFPELHKKYKKKKKVEKEKTQKLINAKINDALDEEVGKITLKAEHFSFVVAVFSTSFLVSGFLYNKVLLGEFGIDMGFFFSISDYISTSVDMIFYALITTMVSVAFFVFGVHDRYKNEIINQQFKVEEEKKTDWLGLMILAFVSVEAVNVILGSLDGSHDLYSHVLNLSLILCLGVMYYFPINRFFTNIAVVILISMSVIMLSYIVLSKAYDKAFDVKYGNNEYDQYKFSFAKETTKDEKLSLITATPSYFFFYSRKNHTVHIVKSDKVNRVTIQPK